MKQVEVSILGQAYVLGCPEGGEALLSLAVASVDKEMTTIRDSGKVKARERIAVLSALNLAYQLAERQSQPGRAAASATAAAASTDTTPAASEADIAALIRRVDEALSDDGQLL